jgi:hypothetical protein
MIPGRESGGGTATVGVRRNGGARIRKSEKRNRLPACISGVALRHR